MTPDNGTPPVDPVLRYLTPPPPGPAEQAATIERMANVIRTIVRPHTLDGHDIDPAVHIVIGYIAADGAGYAGRFNVNMNLLAGHDTEDKQWLIRELRNITDTALFGYDWTADLTREQKAARQRAAFYDQRRRRTEARRKELTDTPWLCEHCARRWPTQRSAQAHERTCWRSGRHGHRIVSRAWQTNQGGGAYQGGAYIRCSCEATIMVDTKRTIGRMTVPIQAWIAHADTNPIATVIPLGPGIHAVP